MEAASSTDVLNVLNEPEDEDEIAHVDFSSPRGTRAKMNWRKLQAAMVLSQLSNKNWTQLAGHAGIFMRFSLDE